MCDFWNGACKSKSKLYSVEGEYCHFQCGNVVEEADFDKKGRVTRKRFGVVMMVGTCLAACGGLVTAASMLG